MSMLAAALIAEPYPTVVSAVTFAEPLIITEPFVDSIALAFGELVEAYTTMLPFITTSLLALIAGPLSAFTVSFLSPVIVMLPFPVLVMLLALTSLLTAIVILLFETKAISPKSASLLLSVSLLVAAFQLQPTPLVFALRPISSSPIVALLPASRVTFTVAVPVLVLSMLEVALTLNVAELSAPATVRTPACVIDVPVVTLPSISHPTV